MKKIAYITNAPPQSGMGKPAREMVEQLRTETEQELTIDDFFLHGAQGKLIQNNKTIQKLIPLPLTPKPLQWWRLAQYLPTTGYDLWHITNQALSFIPRKPTVITVHDLIEMIEPQEPLARPVARFLYKNIPNAEHIICVSQYTKKTVQETYNIPNEKITVIHHGISKAMVPIPNARTTAQGQQLLKHYNINPDDNVILSVGSDHPRKNLATLAAAFAKIQRAIPNTVLIKVGDPGLKRGRTKFLADLKKHNIQAATRITENVDEQTLHQFYALANVLVFPSTFEGFGIPPLEALACGCPVVCSNATSIPEVVGDAAILCNPNDVEAFAQGITEILTSQNKAQELKQKGLTRAQQFTWEKAAHATHEVYNNVLNTKKSR